MLGPSLLWMMVVASTKKRREFRFVPYGSSFSSSDNNDCNRPTISCDGRIPGGVTLELTHWTDNETPNELYADTSTEMALKFAQTCELEDAIVLNNHYDTDGVLSVWTCLAPKEALQYEALLIQGAEAGDFGEWSSDNGVKLDIAIQSFLQSDEEQAYEDVLVELPSILKDFAETGGKAYEDLWREEFQNTLLDWQAIQESSSFRRGPGKIVFLQEPRQLLSPYAVHRGLVQSGLWEGTTRILRCCNVEDGTFVYRYEIPGHGWVKKLVDRHVVPSADKTILIEKLPNGWSPLGGLTGICSSSAIFSPPKEVLSMLHELDEGSH